MQPTQERRTQTSVGMETVGETVNRARALIGSNTPATQTNTDIPVAAIENNTPTLTIPETPQISDAAAPAKTAAEQYLNTMQADSQARLAQTEAKGTASERRIMEMMGLLNTEADTRNRLEESGGVTRIEEQMRQAEQSIARQIAEIDAFDLRNVTDLEQMRIDGSKRDITKRTFGAQAAEFNLQNTVRRAGMAANLRATVAANLALQGNLEAATEQVDKALEAIYTPIRQGLEMEKFFLQRNDVRLGEERAEARDLRMKQIDRQFAEIDRAQSLVDSAVMSGYASESDIKQMVSLAGNPEAQSALARQIVAKGAIQERILNDLARNSQITASNTAQRKNLMELALMGDPQAIAQLGFDPGESARNEAEAMEQLATDKEIERLDGVLGNIESILGNNVGLTTSSGQFRNATISGLIGGQIMNQQEQRGRFGQVVGMLPVAGNIINSVAARQEKDNWIAEVGQVLTEQGFEALIGINERVKLTPITEMEVSLAFRSASALQNAAVYEGEGENRKFRGFAMTEDKVRENFTNMYIATQKIQEEQKGIQEYGYDGYLRLLELQQQSNQ